MDELLTIIEERRHSISEMNSISQKHKSIFIEEERKRNQRENWILRVLKTLKVFSPEQKKVIFENTVKIMNIYHPISSSIDNFDNINFTQVFINLCVEFYNKFEDMDLTHIKTIIRPNNSFIVVDLIKTILELGRKQFKTAVQQAFREIPRLRVDRRTSQRSQQLKISKSQILPQVYLSEQIQRRGISDSERSKRINQTLFEKYNKAIQNYCHETYHERFNQIYFDLLYLNQKNAVRIQRHLDHCFGRKRHIVYDASGLYSQQQIKKMVSQQQERTKNRAAELKELKTDCPPEHLKEYFKIIVEMHSSMNIIPGQDRKMPIRNWLPLILQKNGERLHPFHQVLQINGVIYSPSEYEEKFNKKLKDYFRQLLRQQFPNQVNSKKLPDSPLFNRKEYFDTNISKFLDFMSRQPTASRRQNLPRDRERQKSQPKEGSLPPITSYSVQLGDKSPAKVRSDSKLPSVIKGKELQKALERRMNSSSVRLQHPASRRRMDSIIDSIIRARQYTVN